MQRHTSIFFIFLHISFVLILHKSVSCYSRKCYSRVTFGLHCILGTILSNPLTLRKGTKYVLKILSLQSSLEVPIFFAFIFSYLIHNISNSFRTYFVIMEALSSIKVMNQDFVRLDRFDGQNFIRWQQKMFSSSPLKLAYILEDDLEDILEPTPEDDDELKEKSRKRKEDDFLCKRHILNTLSNSIYDVYRTSSSAKELWKSLESKYKIEEAGIEVSIISNFMDFKMSNNKPVLTQVYEILLIVGDLKTMGVEIAERFLVGAIINKLPSSWNDYKKKLKHDDRKYSLESLQRHLCIEEDSRNRDRNDSSDVKTKVNVINVNKNNQKNKFQVKNDKKFKKNGPNPKYQNNKKKEHCFVCGKHGHRSYQCRYRKEEANAVNEDLVATVTEANHVTSESGWWLDTGATIHISKDRSLFKTYEVIDDGTEVKMGNNIRTKVIGKGTVVLKFTSGKVLTLVNVLHVPDMAKNLISGDLLNKRGFKLVYESDKFFIQEWDVCGKGLFL
jgi:hypothetical protein